MISRKDEKMDKKSIIDVMEVAKRMDKLSLANKFSGNVSIKKDGYIYISPSGKSKETLTEEMISVVDKDGNLVSGLKPSSELTMHSAVYQMRDDIGGVVHSHAPFLTAFAICNKDFAFPASAEFTWDFKVAEVLPYGRPGTADICKGADKLLDKGRNIMLLANHGVLTVGEDVWEALDRLEAAELAAKTCVISKMIGTPKDLPADEVEYFMNL